MDNQKVIKDIIESTKSKNDSKVQKNVENFLYSTAADRIKNIKTEVSKTFFKTTTK